MSIENNTPVVQRHLSAEAIARLIEAYNNRPDCGLKVEATKTPDGEVVKRNGNIVYQSNINGGDSNGS